MPDFVAAEPTHPQPSPLVAADPSLGDHLPAPIECSMILVDLSGFTHLLYQASRREDFMVLVSQGIRDDLNLLARVASSETARRHGVAVTTRFLVHLLRCMAEELPDADEVILDRGVNPEPIEVYRLPERIPDPAIATASPA